MKAALPSLEPILGSVIGALDRYGLVERNESTAEALTKYSEAMRRETSRQRSSGIRTGISNVRQPSPPALNPMQASRVVPAPTWSPTELGKQVLAFYELAGLTDNETPTPKASEGPG